MTKLIATLALLFVVFTNLNATEAPHIKNDANSTMEKCKAQTKKDCTAHIKKHSSKDGNQTSNHKMPKCTATQDENSSMKMSSCCSKGKKKEETKEDKSMKCATSKCGGGKCGMKMSNCCAKGKKKEETKEEEPMKCAPGKCGSGKCGGK